MLILRIRKQRNVKQLSRGNWAGWPHSIDADAIWDFPGWHGMQMQHLWHGNAHTLPINLQQSRCAVYDSDCCITMQPCTNTIAASKRILPSKHAEQLLHTEPTCSLTLNSYTVKPRPEPLPGCLSSCLAVSLSCCNLSYLTTVAQMSRTHARDLGCSGSVAQIATELSADRRSARHVSRRVAVVT